MKKLLVGCGLFVFAAIGVAVGGFLLLKHRADSLNDVAMQMHNQEALYASLASKYPFTPPAPGKAVALSDERLAAYLRVRSVALPVYVDFQQRGADLGERMQGSGKLKRMTGTFEDADILTELVTQLQAGYLNELDQVHMSPHEFVAITHAVYTAMIGSAAGEQRKALQIQIDALTTAMQTAPAQLSAQLEARQRALKASMSALPESSMDDTSVVANGPVLASHRDEILKLANPAFDAFMDHADAQFSRRHELPPQDGAGTTG